MNADFVTITKEELRRALVAAWTDCIPAAHLDLDKAWEGLAVGVPDDVTAAGLYSLDSWECWAT